MPNRPLHKCNKPGCVILTNRRFCSKHEAEAEAEYCKKAGSSSERGYTAAWHKISKLHLKEHPLCERCGRPAELTHHKIAIREGGKHYWDNLESLCRDCHVEEHKAIRWKGRG